MNLIFLDSRHHNSVAAGKTKSVDAVKVIIYLEVTFKQLFWKEKLKCDTLVVN